MLQELLEVRLAAVQPRILRERGKKEGRKSLRGEMVVVAALRNHRLRPSHPQLYRHLGLFFSLHFGSPFDCPPPFLFCCQDLSAGDERGCLQTLAYAHQTHVPDAAATTDKCLAWYRALQRADPLRSGFYKEMCSK